jgi:ketosteroid isomerase-like protein
MANDNLLVSTVLALLLLAPATAVVAQNAEDEIRTALQRWTKDFNAGRADQVCDLFAPELRYDFRGYPERDYNDICTRLQRSMNDQSKRYVYSLDIGEIIVAGDLAVVRLTWGLTVTLPNEQKVTSVEPGMDIFRKGPDGQWKIIRYIAYEAPERPISGGE